MLPALAIAEALVDARPRRRRDPLRRAPSAGIETAAAAGDAVSRTRSSTSSGCSAAELANVRRNLTFVPKLVRPPGAARCAAAPAAARGRRVRRRLRQPAGVLAARRLRIPVVVVSYDRRPGRASALTARFAAAVAVAFPARRCRGPWSPARRCGGAILAVDRTATATPPARRLGLPADRFVVAVTRRLARLGGAQRRGRRLRRPPAPTTRGLAVRHVVGDRFLDRRRRRRRDGADGHAAPGRRLRGPRCERSTPPPTCWSAAAAPARSPRWPSPAPRRSSCRGRAPPRTTRPPTSAGCADQGAAVLLAESPTSTASAPVDRRAARHDPAALAAIGAAAARAGDAAPQRAHSSTSSSGSPLEPAGMPGQRWSRLLACRTVTAVPPPSARRAARPVPTRCACTSSASAARA